jgi:hypothetical protein
VPTATPPTSAPATTTTADRLAAQLATAETAIRDPATPAGQLPTLGHSQQRAYRALVRQPRLVPKVLAQLSPTLHLYLVGGSNRPLSQPSGRGSRSAPGR